MTEPQPTRNVQPKQSDDIRRAKRIESELRDMNERWKRLHVLLNTQPDDDWHNEPLRLVEKLMDIMHKAQGILTCLNVGAIQSESPIHKDLRATMIDYRTRPASASTKPTVATREENLVGERQPTKGDAARGD